MTLLTKAPFERNNNKKKKHAVAYTNPSSGYNL